MTVSSRNSNALATLLAPASLAMLAFPVMDIATLIYGSEIWNTFSGSGDIIELGARIATAIFFWASLYLLGATLVRWADASGRRSVAILVRSGVLVVLAGALLYHGLLWAFTLANGHPPSVEMLLFLRENWQQIPAHVLQTAPGMVVLSLVIALVAAAVASRLLFVSARRHFTAPPQSAVLCAVALLGAWYALGGMSAHGTPSGILLDRDPVRIAQARADAVVDALPARPVVTPLIPHRRGPVIVVLVESLRHDLLETHPEAIPFIRSMYDRYIGFDRAYATASHSNLSDLAFWYSQYPLRAPDTSGYPPDAEWRGVSLFELFKRAGYRTGYISSQNELWGGMINWLKLPAVDFFYDSESHDGKTWENADDEAGLIALVKAGIATAGKIEDSETLEIARRWIDSLGENRDFFLGMNLQNTHFSYVVTPGAEQPYRPSDLGFRAIYYRWPEEHKDRVRNRYLNSVRNVDELLEQFVEYLKQKGIWEDSLFVVLGDNGEAFYEHGFGNHSGPMYEEVVRTLAFMKLPDGRQTQVTVPVSHIDIAATIPEALGLDLPWSFQGRSVLSEECNRPIFMFSNAIVGQFGVVDWPWKYLMTRFPYQLEELYNIAEDPGETKNLAGEFREESERLRESLGGWALVQERYYANRAFAQKAAPAHCTARDQDDFNNDATGGSVASLR